MINAVLISLLISFVTLLMAFKEARANRNTGNLKQAMRGDWRGILVFTFCPFLNVFSFFTLAYILMEESEVLFWEPFKKGEE